MANASKAKLLTKRPRQIILCFEQIAHLFLTDKRFVTERKVRTRNRLTAQTSRSEKSHSR